MKYIFLILSVFIFSCSDSILAPTEQVVFPTNKISYNRQVQLFFNQNCTLAGCHNEKDKRSNLDLTSYGAVRQRFYDVVVPKDTTLSRIIWSIEKRSGSPAMPPGKFLNSNQIMGIKTWIMEGATDTIP
ncbi:MAG: hypothetical protein O3A55_03785 [Bacteroidetes bacterium]|nr:hypothetical protein [Bacteroidota bacterium]